MTILSARSDRSLATGIIDTANEIKLSINASDPSKFDHTGGKIQVSKNFDNPNVPSIDVLEVPARTGITVENIATTSGTFVYLNESGEVVQESSLQAGAFLRDNVGIGILQHGDNVTISDASSFTPVSLANNAMGFSDLSFAIGNASTTSSGGNMISGVSSSTKFQKADGSFYYHAINSRNSNKSPNIIQNPALNGDFMINAWSTTDVTEGKFVPSSVGITAGIYDDGTAVFADSEPQGTVPTNSWVNHRLLLVVDSNILAMQYGKNVYPTAAAARLGIATENFDIVPVFDAIVALGVMTMRGGCTDTTDSDDAIFTQAIPVRADYR